MIEEIIYDYLSGANLGASVFMERPAQTPTGSFIVIQKTGESETNILRRSVIAIQCYSTSLYNAAALSALVISMMERMQALGSVASVKLNNSYNFTKFDSKEYRYQAVFEVYWYQEDNNEQ